MGKKDDEALEALRALDPAAVGATVRELMAGLGEMARRSLAELEAELPRPVAVLCTRLAEAFVAGDLDAGYDLLGRVAQSRIARNEFITQWRGKLDEVGKLVAYEPSNVGTIQLSMIKPLATIPQEDFVAFVEILFGTEERPIDDEEAFTLRAVVLRDGPDIAIGHLYAM